MYTSILKKIIYIYILYSTNVLSHDPASADRSSFHSPAAALRSSWKCCSASLAAAAAVGSYASALEPAAW